MAEPYELHGEPYVVLRSGDLIRQVPQRYADDTSWFRTSSLAR